MLRNWSDTVDLRGTVATPRSTAEVAELVRGADRVLALGSAHSFRPVAVTPGLHIETAALPADIAVNGT
ncbi:MAG: FAD-binding protein, partial [Candidatus Nanopelagicales bacterium]